MVDVDFRRRSCVDFLFQVLIEDERDLALDADGSGGKNGFDASPLGRLPVGYTTSSISTSTELSPPPVHSILSSASSSSMSAFAAAGAQGSISSPPFNSETSQSSFLRQNSTKDKKSSVKTVASACSSIGGTVGGDPSLLMMMSAAGGSSESNNADSLPSAGLRLEALSLRAETLAAMQESKPVKEKFIEMERLMEKLKKKHKKDRIKFLTTAGVVGASTSAGSSSAASGSASAASFIRQPAKLVKKYSSKKM